MNTKIYINNGWEYNDSFSDDMTLPSSSAKFEEVRIPHSVAVTPFNNFDASMYQKLSCYRKSFKTEKEWDGKKVLVTFEGAAHQAEVFLNGKSLYVHNCGYTAFTIDLTENLAKAGEENLLTVKLDSRESLNIPPFGYVIDYMTYGGIYRDVYLEVKNPVYIEDVFIKTKSNHYETQITLNQEVSEGEYTINQQIINANGADVDPCAVVNCGVKGKTALTAADAMNVIAWDLEKPVLYYVVTELLDKNGKVVDTHKARFGFREVKYDESGFYLNGKKLKIRGLNRHQSYPYVGYAMPRNMQIDDADILKYELGLNAVRTSHYPQSQYFIDRCDEIGLLVFTEIPGWQNVGKEEWQKVCVNNVKEMVTQYRNHPSIFMWGVRVNESQDFHDLYTETNKVAHELDSTRPTSGVRYLQNSELLEDVYAYNDFVHRGFNAPTSKKSKVTKTHKGYLISEYNGHMFPTKSFDNEDRRTQHAVRHANVINSAAGDKEVGGSFGWCAFDYNTHKDFGSGDRICYHGVMDMFRNPKLASYVYATQAESQQVGDILEISSSIDIGEYNASGIGDIWMFTNADSIKYYENNQFIIEYTKADSCYKNLPHGPILLSDRVGDRLVTEDGVKKRYAGDVKYLFKEINDKGVENVSKKAFFKMINMMLKGVMSISKMTELYGKYVASWGGSRKVFKFEAYKDGKLVKTVYRTAGTDIGVKAICNRTELVEESTYDVAEVRLQARDENGNLYPYCQEAVTLTATGDIEIIGPKAVSLKGGMAGTYVKSKGKNGNGTLTVTDWKGVETKIPFTVKVSK